MNPPSFEVWVEGYFFRGLAPENSPFYVGFTPSASAHRSCEEWDGEIDTPLLAEYMIRLFEAPGFIADRLTDDEIAACIWSFFGGECHLFSELRRGGIEPEVLARCLRAIATMYTDFFDRVCGDRGRRPDEDLGSRVDSAVYMIWDMGQLEHAVTSDWPGGPYTETGFTVLEAGLLRCRTAACRMSALHGIGHLLMQTACSADSSIRERLRGLVDRFLNEKQPPEWLASYAREARSGCVL